MSTPPTMSANPAPAVARASVSNALQNAAPTLSPKMDAMLATNTTNPVFSKCSGQMISVRVAAMTTDPAAACARSSASVAPRM